jgi:hypothetical protein
VVVSTVGEEGELAVKVAGSNDYEVIGSDSENLKLSGILNQRRVVSSPAADLPERSFFLSTDV